METQTASLLTMDTATDKKSVAAYAQEILDGTGWEVGAVHRRGTRLEPPDSYWSIFGIDINKDEEERELRLVAKGAFTPTGWENLIARLTSVGAGLPVDPLNGVGYPRLFPETQHAYWFYPFDPSMPGLSEAADPVRMARLLVGHGDGDIPEIRAMARRLNIERVR